MLDISPAQITSKNRISKVEWPPPSVTTATNSVITRGIVLGSYRISQKSFRLTKNSPRIIKRKLILKHTKCLSRSRKTGRGRSRTRLPESFPNPTSFGHHYIYLKLRESTNKQSFFRSKKESRIVPRINSAALLAKSQPSLSSADSELQYIHLLGVFQTQLQTSHHNSGHRIRTQHP